MATSQIKKALIATAFATTFTAASGTAIAADGYSEKFGDNKTSLTIGNHYYGSSNYGGYGSYRLYGHPHRHGTLSFEADILGTHTHGRVHNHSHYYWRPRNTVHYFNSLPYMRHQFNNQTHSLTPEIINNNSTTIIIYEGSHGICDIEGSHQHKKVTPEVK